MKEIERLDRGKYLLKRTQKQRNKGLIKLLGACPVKNWFQPLDRIETTDHIKPGDDRAEKIRTR